MKVGFSLFVSGVFGILLVVGVLIFAGILPKPHDPEVAGDVQGTVTIWGTFSDAMMEPLIKQVYSPQQVIYRQKNPATFDQDLVEALATGQGPDLVLLPQDLILKRQKSLQLIPYDVISQRIFQNSYLQQGEIYLRPKGILALPFFIDPMVMYWNRDLFAQAGVVRPPVVWDELYTLAPVLTKRTAEGNITESAVAFGEFRNITHAKDIVAMLMLQVGNPIVEVSGGVAYTTLTGESNLGIPPVDKVLSFYTGFADPRQADIYSWNRALPDSKDMFTSQKLAIYFGYASEYFDLRRKNPLLDFDVAKVPQVKDATFDATIGKIYGVAILKQSNNKNSAYTVALTLAGKQFSSMLSRATFLPPVRRDLYATRPTDAFRTVFYNSAIISRGWQDPAPEETTNIFQEAVESITSGEREVSEAVTRMQKAMTILLEQVAPAVPASNIGTQLPQAGI